MGYFYLGVGYLFDGGDFIIGILIDKIVCIVMDRIESGSDVFIVFCDFYVGDFFLDYVIKIRCLVECVCDGSNFIFIEICNLF